MPRGRPPNVERHRQIARLRAAGLTYQEIGQRLGVTKQYVHQILKALGQSPQSARLPNVGPGDA
jgi:transcriptional regulator with XRE-family HTH domain